MSTNSIFAELLRDAKLDGSNFNIWKRKIMYLLTAENIDYIVMSSEPKAPGKEAPAEEKEDYAEEMETWTKDNKKARIFILGSMTDSLASEYEAEKVAYKIYRRLEQDFGEVSLIKVLNLVNRFITMKMSESAPVNEHLNKLCVLVEDLKNAGYPFSEEVQVMVALNSSPHSWEQFKVSFCHSERNLNMRNLRHHLLMEEDRKYSQGKERSANNAELHLGEDRYSKKSGWNNNKLGADLRDKINKKRERDDNGKNHSSQKIDKRNLKCHNCGTYGHFRSECRKKKRVTDRRDQ